MAGLDDFFNAIRFGAMTNPNPYVNSPYATPPFVGGQGVPLDSIVGPYDMSSQGGMQIPPFQADTRRLDNLSNVDAAQPQRPDPGLLPRIFAGIAGLGTYNGNNMIPLQDEILYGRHNRDTNDWALSHKAAAEGAELESRNNVTANSNYNTALNREITDRRANEYIRRGDIAQQEANRKVEADKVKADIEGRKIKLAEFKARNPGYKYEVDRSGDVYAVNPMNPQEKPIPIGLKSQDFSDLEKHEFRLGEITTQGAVTRGNIVTQGEQSRETASMPTTVETNTTDSTGKTTEQTKTTTRTEPKKYSGRTVLMKGKDGKNYNVPVEEVNDAKANYGMIEVKLPNVTPSH